MVTDSDGNIITTVSSVMKGQSIRISVTDGDIYSVVESTKENEYGAKL